MCCLFDFFKKGKNYNLDNPIFQEFFLRLSSMRMQWKFLCEIWFHTMWIEEWVLVSSVNLLQDYLLKSMLNNYIFTWLKVIMDELLIQFHTECGCVLVLLKWELCYPLRYEYWWILLILQLVSYFVLLLLRLPRLMPLLGWMVLLE